MTENSAKENYSEMQIFEKYGEIKQKSEFRNPIIAMALALGGLIPFTVLMAFSTQLLKQMNFNNLGFYNLGALSFSSAIMCLISPGIVLRIGSKMALVFSASTIAYFS